MTIVRNMKFILKLCVLQLTVNIMCYNIIYCFPANGLFIKIQSHVLFRSFLSFVLFHYVIRKLQKLIMWVHISKWNSKTLTILLMFSLLHGHYKPIEFPLGNTGGVCVCMCECNKNSIMENCFWFWLFLLK